MSGPLLSAERLPDKHTALIESPFMTTALDNLGESRTPAATGMAVKTCGELRGEVGGKVSLHQPTILAVQP